MRIGVDMILDVTREPEALSAGFVYAALKGYGPGSDLYEALKIVSQGYEDRSNFPTATMSMGEGDTSQLRTLANPDGTVERQLEVIDSMGFYPVALVLKRKSENGAGSVPVGEAASTG